MSLHNRVKNVVLSVNKVYKVYIMCFGGRHNDNEVGLLIQGVRKIFTDSRERGRVNLAVPASPSS